MRRFYWELCDWRRRGGPTPVRALAAPAMAPLLTAVRATAPEMDVRIACLVELGDAFDPLTLGGEVLHAAEVLWRHGIALDLWPQLAGEETTASRGRFLNTSTAATFQERLLPLLDVLARAGADGHVGLALDVEPDERVLRAAWSLSERRMPLWSHAKSVGTIASGLVRAVAQARQGRRDLQEFARDLASRTLHVHAAVVPPLLPGMVEALRHWGLGCPMEADDGTPLFPIQAALCYAPLLRRMRGGRPDRAAEQDALVGWATRHRARFDAVVTGMTSVGMLGDEPVYQDPAHLAEDVRALEGLGYGDIALYSLEGLLFGDDGDPGADHAPRRGVDAWLAAAFGESIAAPAQRAAE